MNKTEKLYYETKQMGREIQRKLKEWNQSYLIAENEKQREKKSLGLIKLMGFGK